MSPRVLIDGFFWGKSYGFGRFIDELCRALGAAAHTGIDIIVAVPDRIDPASLPDYPSITWHRLRRSVFPAWEQIAIPRLARRLKCDLIHFPYNTCAVFTGGRPTVVTVHDLLFLEQPVPWRRLKDAMYAAYSSQAFRRATAHAAAVVAVSDTTRRALATAYGIQAKTVHNTVDGFVAAHPAASVPAASVPAASHPYLLHRGGYNTHRNTARVIAAFRAARVAMPGLELRVLGAPDGAAVWATSDDEGIRFLPRVSDAELASLYRGSLCVIATSLQEGFGLPIIEAFSFGVPVITSNRDPMREIAGSAALLVDPTNTDAIADALRRLLQDRRLLADLSERGRTRASAFSSERVARGMLDVYAAALQTSRQRARPGPTAMTASGAEHHG